MARKAESTATVRPKKPRKWSAAVMKRSDALDLEAGVFMKDTAWKIANLLQRSAERSRGRKSTPANQPCRCRISTSIGAGKSLAAAQRTRLEAAKVEPRKLFDKAKRGGTGGLPHGG